VLYRPEDGRKLTVEEAVALAESGDPAAVRDLLEAHHGLWETPSLGVTVPPALAAYVERTMARLLDGLMRGLDQDRALGIKLSGREPWGRVDWWRAPDLLDQLTEKTRRAAERLARLCPDLPSHEVAATASQEARDELGLTRRTEQRERARRGR
jgi:hypothetical protein